MLRSEDSGEEQAKPGGRLCGAPTPLGMLLRYTPSPYGLGQVSAAPTALVRMR
jgi:hypothetical protein